MSTIYTKQLRYHAGGPYVLDTEGLYPPSFLCAKVAMLLLSKTAWHQLPPRISFNVSTEPMQGWHEGVMVSMAPEGCMFPCFDVKFSSHQHHIYIAMQDFLAKECKLKDKDHFWFQATTVE